MEVVSSSMRIHYGLAPMRETHILLNMSLSTSDLITCVSILAVFVGAVCWLLIIDARVRDRERRDSAHWLHQYFTEGGLARALIARWKPQGQLTDRTDSRRD
jgi:hypothetical protein